MTTNNPTKTFGRTTVRLETGFMGIGTLVRFNVTCEFCDASININELHSLGDSNSFTMPTTMTKTLALYIKELAKGFTSVEGWRLQVGSGALIRPMGDTGASGFGPDGNYSQRSRATAVIAHCPNHNPKV